MYFCYGGNYSISIFMFCELRLKKRSGLWWTVEVYEYVFICVSIVVCQLKLEKRERTERTTQLCKKVVKMRPDTQIYQHTSQFSAIQYIFHRHVDLYCWWTTAKVCFSCISLFSPFFLLHFIEDQTVSLWIVQDTF